MEKAKLNLARYPYRGILAEIAAEKKTTRQNIRKQYVNRNPVIIKLFNKKIQARKNAISEYESLNASA